MAITIAKMSAMSTQNAPLVDVWGWSDGSGMAAGTGAGAGAGAGGRSGDRGGVKGAGQEDDCAV